MVKSASKDIRSNGLLFFFWCFVMAKQAGVTSVTVSLKKEKTTRPSQNSDSGQPVLIQRLVGARTTPTTDSFEVVVGMMFDAAGDSTGGGVFVEDFVGVVDIVEVIVGTIFGIGGGKSVVNLVGVIDIIG
ncbi:hypothetical protein HPULCUR_011185 [Helicostylum pulchrum]|uniref:Uncharacterized protein n=1 Tax=Helicostylum pulchrum TaxID=562976 RepID=A0ABP9YFC6_9FUNG